MICNNCGLTNERDNNFCISCGTALEPVATSTDTDFIKNEIGSLRLEVNALKESLQAHGIEIFKPGQTVFRESVSKVAPHIQTDAGQYVSAETATYGTGTDNEPDAPPLGSSLLGRLKYYDWDAVIGGNWLVRIGALAVVLGMGFFLKLAFDNNWIGESGRVAVGIIAGIAMLGAGEYWRSKYPVYSHAISGAGIAFLYLSVFTAFVLYELIGIYPAIGLLALISITSAALAIVHSSLSLALMGIFGGFSAPFILGGSGVAGSAGGASTSETIALLVYISVINIGVILLSTFKKWDWFVLVGLLSSLATFGLWWSTYMGLEGMPLRIGLNNATLIAQTGLTVIFLSFVASTTLFHLVWRRQPNQFDLSLMFFNGLSFAFISFGILGRVFPEWMGGFALVMALFYAAIGYVALVRVGIAPIDRDKPQYDVLLTYISLGIAVVFLTIAIPFQFGGPWVSVAWIAEAMVLLWIGSTSRLPDVRKAAFILYGLSLLVMTFIDTPDAIDLPPGLFQNNFAISYALMAGGAFVTAYMASRLKDRMSNFEMILVPAGIVAGFAILALAVPTQVEDSWMIVTWGVLGLAAIAIGIRIGIIEMRLTGLGVLSIAAIACIFESSVVESNGYTVFFNSRFLAFGPLIASISIATILWNRWPQAALETNNRKIVLGLIVAANALFLWFLSAEVMGGVQTGQLINVSLSDQSDVISLSLTALWGMYAAIVLVTGFFGGWRPVRLAGLGLLGVPVVKLFLVDSFQLDAEFRVAAFMIMGMILLAGGYLYQRHNTAFKDFFIDAREQVSNT